MNLQVKIPTIEEITREACPVPMAVKGSRWEKACIGRNAEHIGVYVIHHSGVIKYIGKTNSPSMSFGMRLRREFQQSASGDKHLYPRLASLVVPPEIKVSFFTADQIDQLVHIADRKLGTLEAIEIFETVLIQVFRPEFQRHHEVRISRHLNKVGYTPEQATALLDRLQKKGGESQSST